MTRTATAISRRPGVRTSWAAATAADGGQRLGQGEPPGVQRLADDRALDVAPAAATSASATRSASSAIPPEAITGAAVAAATSRSRSTFGPLSVPSLLTSVTT